MSFNRATQQPCSPICCSPATFTFQPPPQYPSIFGTQANASKMYNVDPCLGTQPETVDVTYDCTANILISGSPAECCESEGWQGTFEYKGIASPTTCAGGTMEPTCLFDEDCPNTPCIGGGGLDPCFASWEDNAYICFECSVTDCEEESGVGSGMYANNSMACATSTIDADWYASGVKVIGTPETFEGYPSAVDACSFWRKGLRRIWARKQSGSSGGVQVRWFFAKEWLSGAPSNIIYEETISAPQNQLGLVSASIDLNDEIGIQCSGGDTRVFRNIRLGGGGNAGDGSFGEDSGWYDITNKEVEFYYQKPNAGQWTTGFGAFWTCDGSCDYCCEEFCNCGFADATFKSVEAQKLTSGQIENEAGNCIWDAGADGARYGGNYPYHSGHGMFNNFGDCQFAGGTCTV